MATTYRNRPGAPGIVQLLHLDIVHFTFRKKDGTVREAFGTTCPEVLDRILGPGSSEQARNRATSEDTVTYFDMERDGDGNRRGWRSFKLDNLIKVIP